MPDDYRPEDPNQQQQQNPAPYPPEQYPGQYQQQYQPGPYPQQYPPPYAHTPPSNGMAVASLVLGILGLVLWLVFGWVLSIVAVILGHVAKSQIDQSRGAQGGRGMAIAGLVMGWIGVAFAVIFIVLIVAGTASYNFGT